jgi:hypothetical protein
MLSFISSAGDSAHSFPPTGGLGLNCGLADVHNLAYKLAAVHKGWGKTPLLDTYETERRHVALVNARQSIKNGLQIFKLLKTFGTTHDDVDVARSNLYRHLEDLDQKKLIDDAIAEQQEHFDNVGILLLRTEFSYLYNYVKVRASYWLCLRVGRLPSSRITLYSEIHPWRSPSSCVGSTV